MTCALFACEKESSTTKDSDVFPSDSTDNSTDTTTIAELSFYHGADISWITEMEQSGKKFYNKAREERECTALMKELGMDAIRLRVWVNPTDGYCNKEDVLEKAVRAQKLGMPIMIDFHYSDWWADPGKQNIPAAWKGHTYTEILNDVDRHTREVLLYLKEQGGVTPMWVQVGNETANGLLWEVGQADKNPAQYAGIIKAGYNAVKSVCPDSKVIVHIDRGHNRSLQKWNLDLLRQHGATWDITGLSLYPYDAYGCWELGNDGQKISVDEAIKRCISNIDYIYQRYNTPVIIVETGMQVGKPQEGETYLSRLITEAREKTSGHCEGVFYWEPQSSSSWKGYQLGAFNPDGTPTAIMDAFAK